MIADLFACAAFLVAGVFPTDELTGTIDRESRSMERKDLNGWIRRQHAQVLLATLASCWNLWHIHACAIAITGVS
jgi:hypothetical protein